MVGPWGLEPQTSTVSILKTAIARNSIMMLKGMAHHRFTRIVTGISRVPHCGAFSCYRNPRMSQFTSQNGL
jgi:hypothetical protein